MMDKDQIQDMADRLRKEAESRGYHMNPDSSAVDSLVEGLIVNIERYGYPSCPCRLSFGDKEEDLDIICPCDYRDEDIEEHGACYCALYVREDVAEGKEELSPVPERRPPMEERVETEKVSKGFSHPIHRCKVCGYLCARNSPPGKCPICMAGKDRFERFA